MDRRVGFDLDVGLDPGRLRVDDGDARDHVRLVDSIAKRGGRFRELGACVHAFGLDRIGSDVRGDMLAILNEMPNGVGEIQLPLAVRCVELLERGPHAAGIEDVDGRVDFVDRELLGRGVACFDDRLHGPAVVPDHSPVLARIGRAEREDRGGRAFPTMGLEKGSQEPRAHRRRVAREHEEVAVDAVQRIAGRGERVTGPQRFRLDGDVDPVELARTGGRGDDDHRICGDRACCFDHPVDHPPAEERMEVLRGLRPHALAEASGEHDCCGVRTGHRLKSAGAPGFEPGITGPKPVALPLGYAPKRTEV